MAGGTVAGADGKGLPGPEATPSADDVLFRPLQLGDFVLPNRVVMAPLTRARADRDGVPPSMSAEYYGQRATAGLVITEATQVCPEGRGYGFTPGIHSAEQIASWRAITDAVHEAGGRIFMQLWHGGRISHPDLQPGGARPAGPSGIAPPDTFTFTHTSTGMVPVPAPRALAEGELPGIVRQFRQGAANARAAGFDGVEVHAANGYLLDQFLRTGSNVRTDAYGGSVANRVRFPLMVVEAVMQAWDGANTGVRVSTASPANGMTDADPLETGSVFASELCKLGVTYMHQVEEGGVAGHEATQPERLIAAVREAYGGTYIANAGYDAALARTRIARGDCDAVAFGRLMLANPDLPARFRAGAALNSWDEATFYGGGAAGYTDYPRAG